MQAAMEQPEALRTHHDTIREESMRHSGDTDPIGPTTNIESPDPATREDPRSNSSSETVKQTIRESNSHPQSQYQARQHASVSAADVAAQCLSPTVPNNLPADVLNRAREIERRQKQLIADRCGPSPPGSASSSVPPAPQLTTPTGQTSFSTRRGLKPSNLDLGALRRERQLTGPYSANPLLRKRPQEEEDHPGDSEHRLPRIDNMTSGPFTPIYRRMAASTLPAATSVQGSAGGTSSSERTEKKARYMQLCSEIFDLLHS